VSVSLLTNSLATTDHSPVHGAYTYYRRPLLEMGVRLFELAPPAGPRQHRPFLHSKVFMFDDRQALIGSANFDLRSANINIELGLLFTEPELLAELVEHFRKQTSPDAAYELTQTNGTLNWKRNHAGTPVILTKEPDASLRRLLVASLMRRLPHALL
jgi:putative cardiolipin synthase